VFGWHDKVDVPGGRGTARLLAKCKGCGRQFNVDICTLPSDFVYKSSGEWARVATIECRGGATPMKFEFGDGFSVSGPKTAWHDQDLSDDWAEFDEEAGESVSVMDCEARFEASSRK
jgi:hypothetical protein